ncbi:MAG: hypothetical protein ACKVWV_11875 [Planctomycetota bacterium]
MTFSAGWLFTSLIVGTTGGGFFLYGKKQSRIPQLVAGLVLIAESTFIASVGWMLAAAALALVALYLVVRSGM